MSKLSLGVQKVADGLRALPALPEPDVSTVAAMHDGCRRIEAWMTETRDVAALDEARHWLAAVEKYLEAKGAQGPAQTTARLLEARIGALLPRGEPGRGKTSVATNVSIPRVEAHEFRLMDERREVWEDKLPLPRLKYAGQTQRLAKDSSTPAYLVLYHKDGRGRVDGLRVRQLWPKDEHEFTRYTPDQWAERLFALRRCHPLTMKRASTCATCGSLPTGTFNDGSPRYSCGPHPAFVFDGDRLVPA